MINQKVLLGRTFDSTPRITPKRKLIADRKMLPVNLPIGGDEFWMENESHLMTVAPTGAGKGRSVIIPNLLTYPGSIVVTDPKGENFAVTARARREMGHTVIRLDPFHVIDGESDALNPLDLFKLPGSDVETDSQMIADLLSLRTSFNDFWENCAYSFLSGVVGYIAALGKSDPNDLTFTKLWSTCHSDDVVYNLAVVLDTLENATKKKRKEKKVEQTSDPGAIEQSPITEQPTLSAMAYSEIAAFLQKADKERSGVLSTTNSYLNAFGSAEVLKTLDRSTVPLTDIIDGKPISIYLIIPPAKLKSHFTLLRLWIGTILHCITSRRVIPEYRTLFVLDECAQLGAFPALETAVTLCRGYGLQVWTFWQDLSQIRTLYPISWPTMINNCGAVQIFGAKNYSVSSEVAALLGIEPDDVLQLKDDEQIVCLNCETHKIKKVDYLDQSDKLFIGKFDQNPWHAGKPKV